jgi:hypothetical protein
MFTYKFLGLSKEDGPTPYYYGTLPAKPELGHILVMDETRNRYVVVRIDGEGLSGKGYEAQKELANAEIGRGEKVPTLVLKKLPKTAAEKVRKATTTRQFRKDAIREAHRPAIRGPRKKEMLVRGQSFEDLKKRSQ